jgi:NAD(P)-dependent dehydrogenase (short-subunit alcohol dehydrogenase family)
MVRRFLRDGWRVSACARSSPEPSISAGAGCSENRIFFSNCDVADPEAVEGFVSAAVKKFGAPDLLINNAAIINRCAPLWEQSDEEISQILDVNVRGMISVIRCFLPVMAGRGSGIIVNFSSGWGRSTSPEVAPYCATKYAVEGLSAALAQELPAGMAAVALNPGIIDTAMLRECLGAGAGAYEDAETWAGRAVPFLAALDVCCNGKALTVD